MKWKKIGNILILDNKFTVQSDKQLKELSDKQAEPIGLMQTTNKCN